MRTSPVSTPDAKLGRSAHSYRTATLLDATWVLGRLCVRKRVVLDGSRLEHGRVTWLRRGWPDLFEDLAQLLPRIREFV